MKYVLKWGWLAALSILAGSAGAAELVVLVDTGMDMPMAHFENGNLLGGVHKDVGDALAARLGRVPRYVPMPRKRIAQELEGGRADLVCQYIPAWLAGNFNWSLPFFPLSDVVISDRAVAAPRKLADLAGGPIGTVLGYEYPDLALALGGALVRDDAPSSDSNLRKIGAGRVSHAVTTSIFLTYHAKIGTPMFLHAPLLVKNYQTQCAVSTLAGVTVEQVNQAILGMTKDGTLHAIVARYR